MSFAEKIASERNVNIYLLCSEAVLKYYAYVIVPLNKGSEFEKAVVTGNYNIKDYGTIVDFCIGESSPSEEKRLEVENFLNTCEFIN